MNGTSATLEKSAHKVRGRRRWKVGEGMLGSENDEALRPSRLAFVAGAAAGPVDPLPVAAQFVQANGNALISRPDVRLGGGYRLRRAAAEAVLIADAGHWRHVQATAANPLGGLGDDGLIPMDLQTWVEQLARGTGASAVLTPSHHVGVGDWPSLAALLAAADVRHPLMVTLIATAAEMLEPTYLPTFLAMLAGSGHRRLAFIFTDPVKPFATAGNRQRLAGLRWLLRKLPGAWVIGVDPLVATDALAHGAGLVGVGLTSSGRHPCGPGVSRPPSRALGAVPGLFLRSLLEHRSPRVYADWFNNQPVEFCVTCDRSVIDFHSDVEDKLAVVHHNLHTTHEWVLELMTHATAAERRAWLDGQRRDAFEAHALLNPLGRMEVDRTLRALCELDDRHGRATTRQGTWI